MLLTACGDEGTVVQVDLCPGPAVGTPSYQMLQRVNEWNVEVFGLQGEDVAWRRVFAGTESLASIELESAVPVGEQVRLFVEGYGLDNAGTDRAVAVAASAPLVLHGNESVCLCTAPPETYTEDCSSWQCSMESGVCQSPY